MLLLICNLTWLTGRYKETDICLVLKRQQKYKEKKKSTVWVLDLRLVC